MLKFQCTHCRGRLAIQEKHLTRLTTCPDCGQITHPMAGEIFAARQQQLKKRVECDNCGDPLGRLQKSRKWSESTVCGKCYRELAFEQMERDQAESHQSAYLQPLPVADRVIALPANHSMRGVIPMLPIRYFASQHRFESAAITIPPLASADLRHRLRNAAAGLIIGVAALFASLYVLRTLGYLLAWAIATMAVAAALIWLGRRWRSLRSCTKLISGFTSSAATGIWNVVRRWMTSAH